MTERTKKCTDKHSLEGRYANYFEIGHNAFEFVIDFGQSYEDSEEPQIHLRVVTSPAYAKLMLDMLMHSIAQYESRYGTIPDPKSN